MHKSIAIVLLALVAATSVAATEIPKTQAAPAVLVAAAEPGTLQASMAATAAETDRQLESFAERSISSADRSVETIKWVFSVGAGLIAALLGFVGFMGYREVKAVAEKAREEAKVLAMQAVHKELADVRDVALIAKELALHTQRAIRYITIAEQYVPADDYNVREALAAIRDVQEQAAKLQELKFEDSRLQAWTFSMEAYCFAALKDYATAVAKQKVALETSPKQHAINHLNLACYLARQGNLEEAAKAVATAIAEGGDAIKRKAKKETEVEGDLQKLGEDTKYTHLFA